MGVLVNADGVTVVHGVATVLDEVSLGVATGVRVGVVGRNGGGKSTLLRVLAGQQQPDAGRVTRTAGTTLGLLGQGETLDPAVTVRHAVVGTRPEHEWAGDSRARSILDGLLGGLDAGGVGGLQARVGALSGGERRRVALAAEIIADPDVLLLDEPTNHLDVEGVAWLAEHLSTQTRADAAVVAVSHDRWFLDAAFTTSWEVHGGRVSSFDGGYAAYVLAQAERLRRADVAAERRDNLLRKELAWLRRGAPARTSKPRFRVEAASALIADEPPPRDEAALVRFATRRLGKDVIDLVDASVTLGDRRILDRVTWRLAPGERVGIVGVNGSGKSTLLQALAGELALTGGHRRVGKTVALAHLTQQVDELEAFAAYRVIEAIEAVRRVITLGDKEVTASQLATRLGFPGGRQQTRVGDLSGGEKRRLQLLRLLMSEPNVILLDEPTNDLDVATLTSLEDVLDGWAGTLVVVSHDRYLLERIADRQVALLGNGRLRDLPGGVEQYLQLRRERRDPASSPTRADGVGAPETTAAGARPARMSQAGAAQAREARKAMARVEKALARAAERRERLHEQLATVATDHTAVLELQSSLRALDAQREALESEWFAAAEVLD